jgi:hypothetical protein
MPKSITEQAEIAEDISRALLDEVAQSEVSIQQVASDTSIAQAADISPLQHQCAILAGRGFTFREIAEEFGIPEGTLHAWNRVNDPFRLALRYYTSQWSDDIGRKAMRTVEQKLIYIDEMAEKDQNTILKLGLEIRKQRLADEVARSKMELDLRRACTLEEYQRRQLELLEQRANNGRLDDLSEEEVAIYTGSTVIEGEFDTDL